MLPAPPASTSYAAFWPECTTLSSWPSIATVAAKLPRPNWSLRSPATIARSICSHCGRTSRPMNCTSARSPSALPPPRRKPTANNHAPRFDIRTPLHRLPGGADLSQIDAIGPQAALQLVAEIGTDMSRWRTAQHFTSWLTLAPNNKISGGRLLSSRTPPSANRAAAVLRRCAMSLSRTRTALGAFYRRLAVRIGKPKAITATARKLALLVYRVLSGDLVYQDPGANAYHQLPLARELKSLRRRATQFGYDLIDRNTGEVLLNPVS